MPTNYLRLSYDVKAREDQPDKNFSDDKVLVLLGTGTNERQGFLFWGGLPPHDANIVSATLRVWLRKGWGSGPHVLTARRITQPWKLRKLTWNNRPSTTATNAVSSAPITDGTNGQQVDLDVSLMIADVAANQPWYGIRLSVDTANVKGIWPTDSPDPDRRPLLIINWTTSPLAVTDMEPAGGRSVSRQFPVFGWTFRDPDGDAQTEFQLKIATSDATTSTGDFTASEFDTGWIASTDEQYDSSTGAWLGITDGATRYWIVRVRDEQGKESPWSDVQEFRRDVKGTLVINSPIDGGTVEDVTPLIVSTLTGRSQDAVAYLLDEDPEGTGDWQEIYRDEYHEAPVADGIAHSEHIPKGYIRHTGRNYRIRVRSWDGTSRDGMPGDPTFAWARAEFTFVRSATPAPVTSLTVEQEAGQGAGVKFTFNRAAGQAAPDYFALMVDGERVQARIEPDDHLVGGDPIVYAFHYYGLDPRTSHTLEVEAVVNSGGKLQHSQGNATQTFTSRPPGIWLIDDEDPTPFVAPSRRVRILGQGGDAEASLSIAQSAEMFRIVGRRDPVTIYDTIHGHEGTVSGVIYKQDPSGAAGVANFKWMKRPHQIGRRLRLIAHELAIPVELGEVGAFHPTADADVWAVSFDVAQIDEFWR